MAQSGSSEVPHSRFSSGFSSSSKGVAPLPSNGLGFDARPHLQRFAQSSAMPDEAAFQQVRQLYIHHQQQAPSQKGISAAVMAADIRTVSDGTDMLPGPPKDDQQLVQALRSFVDESIRGISPGLMRYHSAPSSMLASIMGNAFLNQDPELGQFFRGKASTVGVAAASADNDPNHDGRHISPQSHFKPTEGNASLNSVEVLSLMGMDVKGELMENSNPCFSASLMRPASDGLVETVRVVAPGVAPSFPRNIPSENGNELIHGVPATKNGLLRHSSSPAGFLSQVNDDNERLMMPSSSGNSSEEGSYERPGGAPFFANYAWDEAGNVLVGSPNASYAVKKRIRDSEEKYFTGSTLIDSQKGDTLEHGASVNHFGPTATSPDNVYFTDNLSPDSVPCRTRAKRGCATHPRSIAERVRRTKISERMKKLQELVPNMDKQTNTAEMLDEAVEYVKYLQRQVQELTENRSKCECSCSSKQKEISSQ